MLQLWLQNNTLVTISNYDPNVIFMGTPNVSLNIITFTLSAGETYTLACDMNTFANRQGFVGSEVTASKPIVVNNGNILGSIHNFDRGADIGIDQSIPINILGSEYISVRGNGTNVMEEVLVIAHQNNTQIFVNGGVIPLITLNDGEWFLIPEVNYSGLGHENMYLKSTNTFYCYQILGGAYDEPTYGMNLLAPLSCDLPYKIDAIPDINRIGNTNYTGGAFVITRSNATLTFNGVVQAGDVPVVGAPDWKTYKISGLIGDQVIESTDNLIAGIFGAAGIAGWAGYYSGFDVKEPEEIFVNSTDSCSLVTLEVSPAYDTYEWFYNGIQILGTLNTLDVFESGSYSVAMTSIYGCVDTARNLDIVVYKNPVVNFSIYDTCLNDASRLVNLSTINTINGDLISDWNWFFGDGNVSSIQFPTPNYTSPGDYPVKLVVRSNHGCKDSLEVITSIKSIPEASFSVLDSCEYLNVVYTDLSTIALPEVVDSWSWDIENNGIEDYASQNPTHLFSSGSYTTKLTVTSSFGCIDDTLINVEVYPKPTAGFISDSICLSEVLSFTGTSSVLPPEIINSFEWNFGEMALPLIQSTDQSPMYEYLSAGSFTVTQRVLTANGCESSTSHIVEIYPKPIALFTFQDDCANQTASFVDGSSVASGVLNSWEWNFGDTPLNTTVQSTTQNSTYDYTQSGDYLVSLIVISDNGCKDTVHENTSRYPMPVPNFNVVSGCKNEELTFVNTSTILAPEVLTSYVWSFGNGSPLTTTVDGVNSYTNNGFYNVTLIASSGNGCVEDTNNGNGSLPIAGSIIFYYNCM